MNSIRILATPQPYTVEFGSKEIKELYVKEEFKATKDVRDARYCAKAKDVKAAIAALAAEQLKFATAKGYSSIKNDKYVLRYGKRTLPKIRA